MSLLNGYSSSDDDDDTGDTNIVSTVKPLTKVEPAPLAPKLTRNETNVAVVGEAPQVLVRNNAGYAVAEAIDSATFDTQRRTFEQLGYARSIHNVNEVVGDVDKAQRNKKRDITELRAGKKDSKRLKKQRSDKGKAEDLDGYSGPWAKYRSSSDEEDGVQDVEELGEEPQVEDEEAYQSDSEEENANPETTEFLGSSEVDYQGRTYMHVPTNVGVNLSSDESPGECFVPKKLIHKWDGHLRGTNRIQFFPNTNHLLLSCGNDNKIFLWSVYRKRECLRGYYGHSKPVKDINFNNDGTRFLSAGYDKFVKLWDTETGECLARFQLNSVPTVVKFNPFNDMEFLVGLSNHNIEHYDINEHKLIQKYDHHLGSINSITFLENKRFMSTSEDKTARVWDLQINIPIKLISDPTLHSMPFTRVHPEGKYIAAQSMDNTVLVFSTKDRYKTNKKKLFTGHNCAGFGIGIDFTPDGKTLISGDSSGLGVFWDWKTCKLIKKTKIDSKAITQVCWNTKEVSKCAFAGASGPIFYWG